MSVVVVALVEGDGVAVVMAGSSTVPGDVVDVAGTWVSYAGEVVLGSAYWAPANGAVSATANNAADASTSSLMAFSRVMTMRASSCAARINAHERSPWRCSSDLRKLEPGALLLRLLDGAQVSYERVCALWIELKVRHR